ncbi:hypothetical protein QJS10_CPA01g02928 [Acorus calamus]|uniref:Uncharacterized protein n=1 Tax=Acorus calamus TaxID=4465 RepID=A0AAV9FFF0_ACOCL|nr:hypothetical protein QJS10_CPA01g02928 [Acorus calamus]
MPCLPCQRLRRTKSDIRHNGFEPSRLGTRRTGVKSWSGPLIAPPYKALRSGLGSLKGDVVMGRNCKLWSELTAINEEGSPRSDEDVNEPRLARSGGMRRDWSFEDLKKRAAATFHM